MLHSFHAFSPVPKLFAGRQLVELRESNTEFS